MLGSIFPPFTRQTFSSARQDEVQKRGRGNNLLPPLAKEEARQLNRFFHYVRASVNSQFPENLRWEILPFGFMVLPQIRRGAIKSGCALGGLLFW